MSFTKSTTDITVHQKLGDNPNIDDGLTAEELKQKFDMPAETLQEDLNNHIDELGETAAASNIGASAIHESDASDNNVQAKLEHLQKEIEGVSQGSVADNSITEAKLNTDFNAMLAKKDGTLQTNLNSHKLGGYDLPQVLDYVMPAIGSYTGNGASNGQEIELGFKPKAVIIKNPNEVGVSGLGVSGRDIPMIAFDGNPYKVMSSGNRYTLISVTDTGFSIGGSGSSTYDAYVNEKNKVFNYIAFK